MGKVKSGGSYLLCAFLMAGGAGMVMELWAQSTPLRRIPPELRRAVSVPLARSRGASRPSSPSRGLPPRRVTRTDDAQKLQWAQSALGNQLVPSGIGPGLHLTPAQHWLPGRAYLSFHWGEYVRPGEGEGAMVVFYPVYLGDGGGRPAINAVFKPTVSGQPLLIDFAFDMTSQKPVEFNLYGCGLDQPLFLGGGPHHVPTVVIPEDTQWYELSLRMMDIENNYEVRLDHVEITPIHG
jgi:hypothetical protein